MERRRRRESAADLTTRKVFLKSSCRGQDPRKSVNLSGILVIVIIKDKWDGFVLELILAKRFYKRFLYDKVNISMLVAIPPPSEDRTGLKVLRTFILVYIVY